MNKKETRGWDSTPLLQNRTIFLIVWFFTVVLLATWIVPPVSAQRELDLYLYSHQKNSDTNYVLKLHEPQNNKWYTYSGTEKSGDEYEVAYQDNEFRDIFLGEKYEKEMDEARLLQKIVKVSEQGQDGQWGTNTWRMLIKLLEEKAADDSQIIQEFSPLNAQVTLISINHILKNLPQFPDVQKQSLAAFVFEDPTNNLTELDKEQIRMPTAPLKEILYNELRSLIPPLRIEYIEVKIPDATHTDNQFQLKKGQKNMTVQVTLHTKGGIDEIPAKVMLEDIDSNTNFVEPQQISLKPNNKPSVTWSNILAPPHTVKFKVRVSTKDKPDFYASRYFFTLYVSQTWLKQWWWVVIGGAIFLGLVGLVVWRHFFKSRSLSLEVLLPEQLEGTTDSFPKTVSLVNKGEKRLKVQIKSPVEWLWIENIGKRQTKLQVEVPPKWKQKGTAKFHVDIQAEQITSKREAVLSIEKVSPLFKVPPFGIDTGYM